jgi:hypothetical protein
METIITKLTNRIINRGYQTWSKSGCIGAHLLKSELERLDYNYSYISWFFTDGEVHINNKLYEVSPFDSKGNPVNMTREEISFKNFLFPKKIIFEFKEIKNVKTFGL